MEGQRGAIPTLKPGVELDHAMVNRTPAQGLASLRAGEFLDAGKPEELGLAPGALDNWKSASPSRMARPPVSASAASGRGLQRSVPRQPADLTVKKWGMEALAHVAADLGDKSLASLKADQIDSVTVVQGTDVLVVRAADKTWKADKLADADEGKLKSLAESFDNLSGSGFVPAGAPELASLANRATVTVVKGRPGRCSPGAQDRRCARRRCGRAARWRTGG